MYWFRKLKFGAHPEAEVTGVRNLENSMLASKNNYDFFTGAVRINKRFPISIWDLEIIYIYVSTYLEAFLLIRIFVFCKNDFDFYYLDSFSIISEGNIIYDT